VARCPWDSLTSVENFSEGHVSVSQLFGPPELGQDSNRCVELIVRPTGITAPLFNLAQHHTDLGLNARISCRIARGQRLRKDLVRLLQLHCFSELGRL